MKLLVVGSSPQSNICLNSQYVSGYHADLLLLDNGDIFICDKNSKNGTMLNGTKLTPGVEVLVRRGDNIVLADTPLDWNRVPAVTPDVNAKKLIGIGSHSRNQIHVAGEKVSRFHATLKQTTDGKWYVSDHSTNGTTVNGVRIPKDTFIKLKKKDEIRCAGIPVANPIPSGSGIKPWMIAVAASLACIAIGFGLWKGLSGVSDGNGSGKSISGTELYKQYAPSTVLIYMGYHYKVTAGALNVKMAFGADEFIVSGNRLEEWEEGKSQQGFASGFYISEDGLIATNLHVARPWQFDQNVQPVEDLVRVWLNDLSHSKNTNYANYISQVKVEGVVDFMYAIPHNEYFDGHNAMTCVEVNASTDTEKDIAILRALLPGRKLPEGIKYVDVNSIPDKKTLTPGSVIRTIGFPMAIALQDIEKKTLQAIFAEGTINASNNDYDFGHTAHSTNGASGSPVFNEKGQLVGVISSGYGNGYNFAVRAEYLKKLLDEKEIEY